MMEDMMKDMMKDKKATISSYTLYWLVFKMGFTIAVCLTIILIVAQGYVLKTSTRSTDAYVVAKSLLYNRAIMNYDEVIDRVYAGNVNESRFILPTGSVNPSSEPGTYIEDIEDIENYMKIRDDVDYLAMKITLKSYDDSGTEYDNYMPVYYRKDIYDKFITYSEGGFSEDQGGYSKYDHIFIVTVGEERKPGLLNVSVVIPNG